MLPRRHPEASPGDSTEFFMYRVYGGLGRFVASARIAEDGVRAEP